MSNPNQPYIDYLNGLIAANDTQISNNAITVGAIESQRDADYAQFNTQIASINAASTALTDQNTQFAAIVALL